MVSVHIGDDIKLRIKESVNVHCCTTIREIIIVFSLSKRTYNFMGSSIMQKTEITSRKIDFDCLQHICAWLHRQSSHREPYWVCYLLLTYFYVFFERCISTKPLSVLKLLPSFDLEFCKSVKEQDVLKTSSQVKLRNCSLI